MLELKDISIGYKEPVVENISFTVAPAECVLLCGSNGTGKTTLLRTVAGLLAPQKGEIISHDTRIVMIPSRIPRVGGFTTWEFVQLACWKESNWAGNIDTQRSERIYTALNDLGIGGLSGKNITELSDGEFQKACIAIALAKKADIILLDEPTAFLDADSRIMVLRIIKDLSTKTGSSFIFSSHDIKDSLDVATRVLGIDKNFRFHDSANEGKSALLSSCFNISF